MRNSTQITLSVSELNVLMNSLQLYDCNGEESDISLASLYNKLYSIVEELQND